MSLPPYPVDSSEQQQFNQWSDGMKMVPMTAIAYLVIYLDGFGHNLAALGLKIIRRQVQRRQRPILSDGILGDISSRDISEYLLALWKEGGDHHAPRYAKIFATEVCLSHGGLHCDRLTRAVVPAEGKRRQCPIVGEDVKDISLRISGIWPFVIKGLFAIGLLTCTWGGRQR